jgi:hypothetical protein
MLLKRLSLVLAAVLLFGSALVASPRQTFAGCTTTITITSINAYRDYVNITYNNNGVPSFTFTVSTTHDGTIASKTVNPAVTGNGLKATINLNPSLVSEGEIIAVESTDQCSTGPVSATAHGLYYAGGPTGPLCDDGRINYNDCEPVAIYPVNDEGSHGIEVWIVDTSPVGRFGFFVSAQDLDALPENPAAPIKIASSKDGFATLYKLPSGEYQVNAGPDKEGKTFIFRFDGLPPGEYPTVTTSKG